MWPKLGAAWAKDSRMPKWHLSHRPQFSTIPNTHMGGKATIVKETK